MTEKPRKTTPYRNFRLALSGPQSLIAKPEKAIFRYFLPHTRRSYRVNAKMETIRSILQENLESRRATSSFSSQRKDLARIKITGEVFEDYFFLHHVNNYVRSSGFPVLKGTMIQKDDSTRIAFDFQLTPDLRRALPFIFLAFFLVSGIIATSSLTGIEVSGGIPFLPNICFPLLPLLLIYGFRRSFHKNVTSIETYLQKILKKTLQFEKICTDGGSKV